MALCTLGLDYGTNSLRAVVAECGTGEILACSVVGYPSGQEGVLLDETNPLIARQHPGDYLFALEKAVSAVLAEAGKNRSFEIAGIGVSATGSNPIPVDRKLRPLALSRKWRSHPAAQCWLWKDHSSAWEAAEITRLANKHRPELLEHCEGLYSAEWWWAKLWHCLRVAPDVFNEAWSWLELSDFIPAVLAGRTDATTTPRGRASAGHRALFDTKNGGYPDRKFLSRLDPRLAALRDRLSPILGETTQPSGTLSRTWAKKLGLPAGIPIAMGEFDVHYGALACGVAPGRLIKIVGTSTCDYTLVATDRPPHIPGVCAIMPDVFSPGAFGIEAGQPAVGDLFRWWVETSSISHADLSRQAAVLRPGQSGLLALDWNNGNRSVLNDQQLTGLLIGQTLHTKPAEIYRALIEATAFSARILMEQLRECGVPVREVVCGGGVAEKNPLLLQIYADVLGCEIRRAGTDQVCAFGAAIAAAVAASIHPDFKTAQKKMVTYRDEVFRPDPDARKTYTKLYKLYRVLHDGFGGVTASADFGKVMKALIALKAEA